MASRRVDEEEDRSSREELVKVHFSPVNEQVVLAACIVDAEVRERLTQVLKPDQFLVEEHRPIWAALLEMARRKLAFDWRTLQQVGGDRVNAGYLRELAEQHAAAPEPENLAHHVDAMHWDRQRAVAIQGPLNSLLEALRNPAEAPERVRALARHVGDSFTGAGRSHIRDSDDLVTSQVAELRRRMGGHACWPYGVPALDRFEEGARDAKGNDISGRARMIPGAAPGEVTVLTAVSGAGKSTMAAHLTIGLARQRRRVLYGSWEPECGMTLELIATMALGWSRSEVTEGRITHEELVVLEEKMHQVSSWVSFMENPFQRVRAGKESNARNLDLIHQHIVDSGCEVFVADLWDRCLVDDDPSEEKRALWRQHSIAQETRTHNILLAQQRLKDVEMRADKRPTREGIMGSSAWVTMADTILAPHRPALFKKVEDDKLELIVWKQRWGVWPAVVEFEWDAEFGSIANGRTIPFEHAGQEGGQLGEFLRPDHPKGPKRRSRG